MCQAFPAIFGLAQGAQSALFAASLGLTAANSFAQRSAAQANARQTYETALIANQSAEDAKRLKQQALEEQKSETEKSTAQNVFAKNIERLMASRAILATERAGTTINLLLMDQERQAANYRESINQSLESARRQHLRNIQATESEFANRRNQMQSNVNNAYNQIPSLANTLLDVASTGLSSYTGIRGLKFS